MASDDRFHVNCRSSFHRLEGYHLQFAQYFLDVRWFLRLNGADDDILASLAAAARFVDHAE
jgi:hypothetical protein